MDLMLAIWLWLVVGHQGLTPGGYALNALFGLLGAAVTLFALNPTLDRPKLDAEGDLEVGAMGFIFVGVGAAIGVGHSTVVPFLAGMLAPIAVPFLLNEIVPLVLRAVKPLLRRVLPGEGDDKEKKS